MLRKGLLLFLIVVLSAGLLFANDMKSYKSKPMTPEKLAGPHNAVPAGLAGPYYPMQTDDPIGEVFPFGTTWYDIQHNGSCGHQLNVDPNGYVHMAWMNGLNNGASQRHIFYNLMDSTDNLLFGGGVQVDQLLKAGYTTSSILSDNRAIITHHQGDPAGTFHTAISYDFIPYIGAFMGVELPWVYELGVDLEVIWPKVSVDINDRIHVISTENPASGVAGAPQRQYYGWAEYDPMTSAMTTCEAQEMISWTMVIAGDVASSPVSSRSAISFMQMNATNPADTNQYDNDVIIVISDDGLEWDWSDTINVTNWADPDSIEHNDTLTANTDTLRAFTSMNLMFDYNDVLHVFFATRGYWHYEGTMTWGDGFIWHWDEVNQVFSMVANAWYENTGALDPGAWNIYVNRASAAVDPVTGDIFCMYQRYVDVLGPSTTNPYPYIVGDTTDISAANFPNGDIWVSKSTNDGYSWSEGINVTATHTPGAAAGLCMSELTPSVAPQIYNDQLHIFYIIDKDAGAVVQSEGGWTLNDAAYQRIDLDEIPESPRFMPYPMHHDSTGMPPDSGLSVGYNNEYGVPSNFDLSQNYPNPFNPVTSISYSLNMDGFVTLKVYNISGEEVANLLEGNQTAGNHEVEFNAAELSSGVYFYALEMNGFTITRKMVLMK